MNKNRRLFIGIDRATNPHARPKIVADYGLKRCEYCGIAAQNKSDESVDPFYQYKGKTNKGVETITSCAFCIQSTHLDVYGMDRGILLMLPQISSNRIMKMAIYRLQAKRMDEMMDASKQKEHITYEDATADKKAASVKPELNPVEEKYHNRPSVKASETMDQLQKISDSNIQSAFSEAKLRSDNIATTLITVLNEASREEYPKIVANISSHFRYVPHVDRLNRLLSNYFMGQNITYPNTPDRWESLANNFKKELT